jgi:hypothetical protein
MNQPSKPPCYFHLLWEEDLDDLHELLERILERRGEILTLWYELYRLHLATSAPFRSRSSEGFSSRRCGATRKPCCAAT